MQITPKHPTPWSKVESEIGGSYIQDSEGNKFVGPIRTAAAEIIISAANEIGKPVMVKEHGLTVAVGAYVLYVSDGMFSTLCIGRDGGKQFVAACGLKSDVIAWLRLPDLPVEDEFENAWEKHKVGWPGTRFNEQSKLDFRAGWNAAKGAK